MYHLWLFTIWLYSISSTVNSILPEYRKESEACYLKKVQTYTVKIIYLMWAKEKKSWRLGVLITQTKWRLRSVAVFVRAMIVKANNKYFIFIANVHIIYQCFRIFSLKLSLFFSLLIETLKLISTGITANIFFIFEITKFTAMCSFWILYYWGLHLNTLRTVLKF